MKRMVFLLFVAGIVALPYRASTQDSLRQQEYDEAAYYGKKHTARTLMIGGGISMGASFLFMGIAVAQGTVGATYSMVGGGQEELDQAAGSAVIGAILFFGGAAALIAGLITNGTANKMKPSHLSFNTTAPPLQIGDLKQQQQGVTARWRLGK